MTFISFFCFLCFHSGGSRLRLHFRLGLSGLWRFVFPSVSWNPYQNNLVYLFNLYFLRTSYSNINLYQPICECVLLSAVIVSVWRCKVTGFYASGHNNFDEKTENSPNKWFISRFVCVHNRFDGIFYSLRKSSISDSASTCATSKLSLTTTSSKSFAWLSS